MPTITRNITRYLCTLVVILPLTCFADLRFDFLPIVAKVNNKDYSIGAVRDIVKDHRGFIWIGGENGLARFDGQRVLVYNYDFDDDKSISSNFIWGLAIDQDNVLWVATTNGLNRYNHIYDNFDRFSTSSPEPLNISDNNINALGVSESNHLFIGTSNGLSVFNPERDKITHHYIYKNGYHSTNANFIQTIEVDKNQNIWIGTRNRGVKRFDLATGSFHKLEVIDKFVDLESGHISAIETNIHDGSLWLGTYNNGVYVLKDEYIEHYTYQAEAPQTIGSNVITDIYTDTAGVVWIAADHGGINRFNAQTKSFERFKHNPYDKHSLGSNSPFTIHEDDQGNIWVGLFPFGVSFLNHSATLFTNHQHKPDDETSLSNSSILSFYEDSSGTVWVGTENGLNSFEAGSNKIKRHTLSSENNSASNFIAVLSISEDVNGELLVGTWSNGLYRYNSKTGVSRRYFPDENDPSSINSPFIWKILKDKKDNIWLATETGGLNRYLRESDSFEHFVIDADDPYSISSNQLWSVIEDAYGDIWVATQNGLDKLDKQSSTFKHFRKKDDGNSISGNQILSLFADSQGLIWIGARDAGLNIFDPQKETFQLVTSKDGLPSQTVFSIVEDQQQNIWVTTFNGVARVNRKDFSIDTLDESLGFLTNTFNRDATFVDKEGKLYLGSIEGVSVFHPEKIELKSTPPPVVITDFRILNKPVRIGKDDDEKAILRKSISETKSISLEHYHTMFSFDFAALSYRAAENNSYAYMLENFDADWNYVGNQRTAIYTNIDPGKYIFKVKAANNLGQWNEQGQSIAITIRPPIWRTTWAYISYCLIAIAFIYFVNKHKHLREMSEIYRTLSTTDTLTKAYNRAGIEQIAQNVFENRDNELHIGLMVIDLDHFKRINDNYGHDAGDRVLKEFVMRVNNIIRSDDYLGRWGGEEFILLSSSKNMSGLLNLAEKIRLAIQDETFDASHSNIQVTASIGIANSQGGGTFEEVVKRADVALYQAKTNGRNTVVSADEP